MGARTNNPYSSQTAGSSGDGSGGYGVSQTNGKYQSVPQVDPSAALAYYAQAGTDASNGIAAGNTAYQASLQQAAQQMNVGYMNADNTLQPLSTASANALTLMQQMLGVTPPPATTGYNNQLLTLDPKLTSTANLIAQANTEADPNQRATLQSQITQQLGDAGTQGVTAAQAAITNFGAEPNLQNPGTGAVYNWQFAPGVDTPTGITQENPYTTTGNPNSATEGASVLAQNQANWTTGMAPLNNALTAAQQNQQSLQAFSNNFNQAYTPTLQQAYTPQQVQQQVETTPGYQFNLDQGNQQILRNQASVGNLGTGNTQVALQNYGENYALNGFNSYMGNLENVVNAGLPATEQLSVNQANQGGYLSNLTQLGGQANNAASTAEGAAMASAQNQMGTTSYNASLANAQLQMTAWQTNQSQGAGSNPPAQTTGQGAQQNASGAGFYQGEQAVVGNATNNMYSGASNNVGSNGGAA